MDLSKRVGMNIRHIRKSRNLTIDELAEKCDFHSPYLSEVERGERNITLQTLDKILNVLNVEPGSVIIPINNNLSDQDGTKEELIKILLSILNDKDPDDIRMILNITNEIYGRFKNN